MNQPWGMKKGIGFISPFCIAIGVIVGQSTIVSLLQAAGIAGWGFLGAMAIAYVLMLCNSATFAELAFQFRMTPVIAVQSMLFALLMGFVGGFVPAWRAARLRIVDCLRAA